MNTFKVPNKKLTILRENCLKLLHTNGSLVTYWRIPTHFQWKAFLLQNLKEMKVSKLCKSWRFWWCQEELRISLRKGENVNHASFDNVEKKSHVCHHQKGGECECMYTWFWWCQKKNQTKLLQKISMASRLIQDCFNKQGPSSRLTQDQALH